MRDVAYFLYAEKHESLFKIEIMNLMEMVKYSQSSQNSKFAMSLQYLKKKVRDEVDFLHADKNQVSFNTLGTKISYKVILSLLRSVMKHSQITQRNKFAMSLQYLKKIS